MKFKTLDPVIRMTLIVAVIWAILAIVQVTFLYMRDKYGAKDTFIPQISASVDKNEKAHAAGCLIEQDNKYLMVYNSVRFYNIKDSWLFSVPGGSANPNESAPYAAVRETYEETGIRVNIVKKLVQFDNGFILYICKPLSKITDQHVASYSKFFEISRLAWLNPLENNDFSNARFMRQMEYIEEYYKSTHDPLPKKKEIN